MTSYISVKVPHASKMQHIAVPIEIYTYVKQLENAINYPQAREKLIQKYPGRFTNVFMKGLNASIA